MLWTPTSADSLYASNCATSLETLCTMLQFSSVFWIKKTFRVK